jgi:hypothetical protein
MPLLLLLLLLLLPLLLLPLLSRLHPKPRTPSNSLHP